MKTKMFHLGDILSVVGGRLVSPSGINGVYIICEFLNGGPVWTHQLPRVCRENREQLLGQHPQLRGIDYEACNTENWRSWLAARVAEFGASLEIAALEHPHQIDPVSELAERVHPDNIITVVVGDKPGEES